MSVRPHNRPSVPFPGVLAAAALLAAAPAAAVTVSGHVTDDFAVGIFDVDLDFTDSNTGQILFTPNDNTDFNGFYSVDVPVGTYDIRFRPPLGSPYLEIELRDVAISGITTLDQTLFIGRLVSGSIVDEGAAPLFNVDLDFRDISTGDVIDTNNDNSDSTGVFNVLVPAGNYDILFTAPVGQPYAGLELLNVAVPDSVDLGTHVLPPGFFVTGTVVDPGMLPVTSTDLDFEDSFTGAALYTPRDNTDSTGAFAVAAPAGTFDVIVKSPPTGTLAWELIPAVSVPATLALGTVQLSPGYALTGTVQDAALQPLVGGDLDLIDALGREVPMPDDNAGVGGAFSLLAKAGTYDVAAFPPAGVPLAAAIQRGVTVSGPTVLGAFTLVAGHQISGQVTYAGNPVAGADIDAFDVAAGSQLYPTAGDDTDAAGQYAIRLPAGSYILVANPPVGSGLGADVASVSLSSDVVQNFQLSGGVGAPEVPPATANLRLDAPFPNPFRDSVRLGFEVPRGAGTARLEIFDIAGRRVRTLAREAEGRHAIVWDGRTSSGHRAAAGVYHVRLKTETGAKATRKVVVRR